MDHEINALCRAIANKFFLPLSEVKKDVQFASLDPGEWAPDAFAIIYCEGYIPNGDYIDAWAEISAEIGMLCEPINAAVIAVWKD